MRWVLEILSTNGVLWFLFWLVRFGRVHYQIDLFLIRRKLLNFHGVCWRFWQHFQWIVFGLFPWNLQRLVSILYDNVDVCHEFDIICRAWIRLRMLKRRLSIQLLHIGLILLLYCRWHCINHDWDVNVWSKALWHVLKLFWLLLPLTFFGCKDIALGCLAEIATITNTWIEGMSNYRVFVWGSRLLTAAFTLRHHTVTVTWFRFWGWAFVTRVVSSQNFFINHDMIFDSCLWQRRRWWRLIRAWWLFIVWIFFSNDFYSWINWVRIMIICRKIDWKQATFRGRLLIVIFLSLLSVFISLKCFPCFLIFFIR